MARQAAARGLRVHPAQRSERGRGEDIYGQLAQLFTEEAPLRGRKIELHSPVQYRLGEQVAESTAQHSFRPPVGDQLAALKRENELDEAVIEVGDAGLDRVRHRVAVL